MYRKFSAENIFTGRSFTGPGYVLITDMAGRVEGIVPAAEAGDEVEITEGIISPGFINAHCHLELSHMKGKIAEATGLVNFVQQVMGSRAAGPEEIQQHIAAAEQEMYNNGIVGVGDICNTTDTIEAKKTSKIQWHNFIEVSGFVEAAAQKRFDAAAEILNTFNTAQLPTANRQQLSSLSPHAPYSVSKKLVSLLNDSTANELISIHNQESAAEDDLYISKEGNFLELYKNFGIDISSFSPSGKSSFSTWINYFTKGQKIISVHNTLTRETDLESLFLIPNSSFTFCLCPNANLYIERTLPPIEMLMRKDCKIVLGTDSYASNHQLSIIAEINTLQTNFQQIPLETMLQWATLNGAETLRMEKISGSFDKGKIPGVVQIFGAAGKMKSRRIL